PVEPTDLQRTEAEQLKIVLKRSRQETHISISQQSDKRLTSPSPNKVVPDDDEDDDDDDEEEEIAKDDEEDKENGKGGDEVRESEGESEEEEGSFDPIPR
nr:hypothetical protein [Tanacetum cinerariifolium]